MWVTFNKQGEEGSKIMSCFYDKPDEQEDLMNRADIDEQVKEWQKSNIGQPPKFYSRLYNFEFISDSEAMRRNIIY
ncbi:MAG: hypothetical protein ACOC2U_04475 [bacterium]